MPTVTSTFDPNKIIKYRQYIPFFLIQASVGVFEVSRKHKHVIEKPFKLMNGT